MLLLEAVVGGKPKFTIKALRLSAGQNQLYLRQVTRTGSRLLAPTSRSTGWLAERKEWMQIRGNLVEFSAMVYESARLPAPLTNGSTNGGDEGPRQKPQWLDCWIRSRFCCFAAFCIPFFSWNDPALSWVGIPTKLSLSKAKSRTQEPKKAIIKISQS